MSTDALFNLEAERTVVGCVLLVKSAIEEVHDFLLPKHFSDNNLSIVYQVLHEMYLSKIPVDIVTVTNELKKKGKLDKVGGPFFITTLTNRVGSAANIKEYASLIIESWVRREIIDKTAEIAYRAKSFSHDAFSLISDLDQLSQTLNNDIDDKKDTESLASQVDTAYNKILTARDNPQHITGIPTGHKKLDMLTGGWQEPDLIILAARPGAGKTTKALSYAEAALLAGVPVGIFSLEMSAEQLINKMFSKSAKASVLNLRSGEVSNEQLEKIKIASQYLKSKKLFINDKPAISPNYIRTVIRKWIKEHGCSLIIIDYLQLMKANKYNQNREAEIASISGDIKKLCKEFKIPIIALSQLSRSNEKRANKRPVMSDLRESGAIEQDADVIIALYNPSHYFEKKADDPDYKHDIYSDLEWETIIETLILKHRNGAHTRTIVEFFEGAFSTFYSPEGEIEDTSTYKTDISDEF